MNKPLQIIELEKILGFKLKQFTRSAKEFIEWDGFQNSKSYLLDSNQNIIGLDLSHYNKIEDISFLKKFKNLLYLNLEDNWLLSDFSPLKFLNELKVLNLSRCLEKNADDIRPIVELQNLPLKPLNDLKKLIKLELRSNHIIFIEPFKDLFNLKHLDLSNNQICLAEDNELSFKEYLRKTSGIKNEKLQDAISKFISNGNDDKIIIKTYDFKRFKELEYLNISNNNLDFFDKNLLKDLPKLKELYLVGNPIQNIPKEIFDKYIFDYEPEDVLEDVRNYFIALAEGQIINAEAKVIWIGNGEAGKTTLSHQFRKNEFVVIPKEERTHGILIEEWTIPVSELPDFEEAQRVALEIIKIENNNLLSLDQKIEQETLKINQLPDGIQKKLLKSSLDITKKQSEINQETKKSVIGFYFPRDITLKLWDFGGQEYYHATHSLFLSNNAMYFLVWDAETNKQDEEKGMYPLEYWRESIKNYAPKNIVFEIQNKENGTCKTDDANLKYKIHLRKENDTQEYDLDIKKLKQSIFNQLHHLDHLAKPFPKVYDDIRALLANQKEMFLSFEAYEKLCQENDNTEKKILQNDSQIQTLTNFLHETGAIICYHYQNNISEQLKDYVFLNPVWLSDYIYKILSKDLQGKGEFDFVHVKKQIKTSGITPNVWIDLMKEFELIFEIEKKGKTLYVAPQYLSPTCTNEDGLNLALDYCKLETSFEIHFPKFLPKSLFLRFISQYGSKAENYLYWKNGLFFKHLKKGVYATCDYKERKILIKVENNDYDVTAEIWTALFELSNKNENIELFSKEKKSIKEIKEYKEIYQKEFPFIFSKDFNNDFSSNFANEEETTKESERKVNSLKNETELKNLLKDFEESGNSLETVRLLGKLEAYVNDKGTFGRLRKDFSSNPTGFEISDWKAKIINLIQNNNKNW
ncbi:MAG: hypothetical protein EAZ85_00290 [Bacteroidetes bacterium]|nr:MAG: hypothetical protein EAZ85_00290 [Bacteroidota bacterium]TAG91616.1 MAG: hypothetical protein EAZ20_03160 [Bacteroidota bacterium]